MPKLCERVNERVGAREIEMLEDLSKWLVIQGATKETRGNIIRLAIRRLHEQEKARAAGVDVTTCHCKGVPGPHVANVPGCFWYDSYLDGKREAAE